MIHKFKNIIKEGDLVILYFSPTTYHTLKIENEKNFHNKFGSYKLKEFIGKEYGSKIASHKGKGYGYLLHPTPEWWSLVLNHRTQILYQPDISLISSFLNLKPGVKVIESGTGSGSFSHSIARVIAPTGHLYSFEYHEERSRIARQEFQDHGLSDFITVAHRDVCLNGFNMEDEVDAVFLDLPAPWTAIESAKRALKKNSLGRICCFSPCIEQVQRTCITLNEQGFNDISTYEVLTRNHDLRCLPQPSVEEAIEFLKQKKLKAKAQSKRDAKGNIKKSYAEGEESQGTTTEADDETKEPTTTAGTKSVAPLVATSKPFSTARGHTSYLTFAMLPPRLPVEEEVITSEQANENGDEEIKTEEN